MVATISMTVHEAGAQLYGWFSNNDCYDPEKDFNKLVLVTESEEQDKAAIECALESLEEVVIVKKKTIKVLAMMKIILLKIIN